MTSAAAAAIANTIKAIQSSSRQSRFCGVLDSSEGSEAASRRPTARILRVRITSVHAGNSDLRASGPRCREKLDTSPKTKDVLKRMRGTAAYASYPNRWFQCESSKPILMSHHPQSHQLTLGRHLPLQEREFEHSNRTDERRCDRIDHHPAVAQVSTLAHQRSDHSRTDYHLPKMILPRFP